MMKQTVPDVSKELTTINNQFIEIIKKIKFSDNSDLLEVLLSKVEKILIEFQESKKTLQNFIRDNETFQKLLKTHLSVFDADDVGLKDFASLIFERVNEYSPYKKNTDFIVTIALLEVIAENRSLIKGKDFAQPKATGFSVYNDDSNSDDNMSDYTIEMLNSEELAAGLPMVLGGITPCCLNLGATGGNFSLYSMFSPYSNFIVVKHNGKIISHALVWLSEDGKTLVIDSIDPTQQIYKGLNSGLIDSGLLIYLYNNFAEKFLEANPQIESVNMSMGGNTMGAIPIISDYHFKKKIFGPFKSQTGEDDKQYYSVSSADKTPCGALLFNKDNKFLSITGSALPSPEYWIELDSSKAQISPVMSYHSIIHPNSISLEHLMPATDRLKISATVFGKAKQSLLEKEKIQMQQQLPIITTIKEVVKHSGWIGLVNPSLPKSGNSFCMQDFSTHKSTYLHQVKIAENSNNQLVKTI